MKGFIEFIRTRGVVGLAVGFILGGAVSALVSSLVEGIINPFITVLFGGTKNMANLFFSINSVKINYGEFVAAFVDFVVIALVVYFGVKGLGLDKLDKKKK